MVIANTQLNKVYINKYNLIVGVRARESQKTSKCALSWCMHIVGDQRNFSLHEICVVF